MRRAGVGILAGAARTGVLLVFGLPVLASPVTDHTTTAYARGGPDSDSIEVAQRSGGPESARHPLLLHIEGQASNGSALFTNPSPSGYTPAQIQAYLGLAGDGRGQTIAIVAPFDNPNVLADLNVFSATFGLPLTCDAEGADHSDCIQFTKAKRGRVSADPGWALEIALDVQWAHAVAPRADILLVEVATDELPSLMRGIDYAAARKASVISNSWGTDEFSGEERYDKHCRLRAAVCIFASGNSGNPHLYPAASPYVIAVGGTTLQLAEDGSVIDEEAWGGSGGGISAYESRPAYQIAVNAFAGRGAPDVSYNANPVTGFPVYDSFGYAGQDGWFRLGGTSVAAPQWAGIIAVANQLRASIGKHPIASRHFASHDALYALAGSSALYDVTSGSNGACGAVCDAGAGFDFVTGLGSPRPGIDVAIAAAP